MVAVSSSTPKTTPAANCQTRASPKRRAWRRHSPNSTTSTSSNATAYGLSIPVDNNGQLGVLRIKVRDRRTDPIFALDPLAQLQRAPQHGLIAAGQVNSGAEIVGRELGPRDGARPHAQARHAPSPKGLVGQVRHH